MSKDFGTFSLAGKQAIITGGGSGIGRAICLLFAKRGAIVHVLDLNHAEASETVKLIKEAGGAAAAHKVDVVNVDEVDKCFAAIAQQGRIDILVNNAGIGFVGDILKTTTADMDRLYQVNVLGVFNTAKAGVKHMIADKKGGAIVNLASIASVIGLADRFAYSMSKGAVLTMTYSIATDYVKQGIRCNCVTPGRIHTPFVDGFLKKNYPGQEAAMYEKLAAYQPVGRMGTPEEVAAVILFLCSDESKFVTGAAYAVDGGVACRM